MTPIQAEFPTTPTSQRESATFFKRDRALLVLGMMIVGLLVIAPAAFAGKVHVFGSTFGTEGSGPGQLKEPSGVAVNEVTLANTGDVYVADTGNNRVQWFSPEGTELKGEINGGATPAKGFSEPSQIAIDNSTNALDPSAGDVYVADFGHNVVDKFGPEGNYIGQITSGKEGAPLGEIYGVAVDPQGLVWVYQASGEIDSYSNALTNTFLASTESPFGTSPGFAVDSADDLYVNRGLLQFAKLTSSGSTLVEAVNPEGNATAAAVNSADDVFIDEGTQIGIFDPGASLIEHFGTGHLANSHGVAIDSTTGLGYASNLENGSVTVFKTVLRPTVVTGDASNLTTEDSATLNATVNPEGVAVTSCVFEYGPTTSYGSSAQCTPEPGSGSSPVTVSVNVSGLEVGRYHYRVLASNVNGESVGTDSTFIVGGQPAIFKQALAGVSVTTAKITARLNPQGLDTAYQLQYGTTTAYGTSTPPQDAGNGLGLTGILISLSGLREKTEYHARVVASNAQGTVASPDIPFTTAVAAGASTSACPNETYAGFSPLLPDCRAYEAVSPGGGPGEVYVPVGPGAVPGREEDITTELSMRAAGQGGAVAYIGEPGEVGGSGATGRGLGNQFLAVRDAAQERWDVSALTPTIDTPEEPLSAYNPIYQAFSSDLSIGILESNSASFAAKTTPAGPRPCTVLYSRTTDSRFHPLFTKTLTPGFCGQPLLQQFSPQNLIYAGANEGASGVAGNSRLLLQSSAALVEGAEESGEEAVGSNLYESVGGTVRLVSVLPGEKPDANAVFGGPQTTPRGIANSRPDLENVISADGSRIFWTDLTSGRIYMRLNGTSTVPVSEGSAKFWGATPDGHFVLYTEGETLWRYDTEAATREELVGTGAKVQGVTGFSEDGAYVYFVAAGALSEGSEERKCRRAGDEEKEKLEKGEGTLEELLQLEKEQKEEDRGLLSKGRGCNLYVEHTGARSLVAVLSAKDNELQRQLGNTVNGVWQPELGSRTAQVSDGGRELVFQSTQRLTGYDNSSLAESESGPERGAEVFVYDAGSGKLTCASCDPGGAPPVRESSDTGAGTYLPMSLSATSLRRWVSADGSRVFFDSSQPLVPQDSNGAQDVYEWEREGTIGCPTATSKWGGCVSLISGGNSSDLSFFVDASADGNDVFFTHRGQLAGTGRPGGLAELLDARVDGGFPEFSTACTGTGCQGVPPAPPSFATPASATFSGAGNFPAPSPAVSKKAVKKTAAKCKRGFAKKRNRCVNKRKSKGKTLRASDKRRSK